MCVFLILLVDSNVGGPSFGVKKIEVFGSSITAKIGGYFPMLQQLLIGPGSLARQVPSFCWRPSILLLVLNRLLAA